MRHDFGLEIGRNLTHASDSVENAKKEIYLWFDPSELVSLEEVERRYIAHVLAAVGGNRSHAARILGIDRKTLYRKLESYGIEPGGGEE